MFQPGKNIVLFVYVLLISIMTQAQSPVINELVTSNRSHIDDFGETADWIELYNPGPSSLDLNGMGISDRNDHSVAWIFENTTVKPNDHLLIYASGKDITEALSYKTLIDRGESWKYIIPTQNIYNDWRLTGYDDSGWSTGNSGFGYGDGDDQTILPNGTKSIYLRREFYLYQIDDIIEVLLHVDYDDAFVAYLNGVEVARANIGTVGDETPFDATPETDHEAIIYTGQSPEKFDVSDVIPSLKQGQNALCIQAYNVSNFSTDFSIIPFLTFGKSSGAPNDVPEILDLPERKLHTDFKLSSAGETVYLFNVDGSILDSVAFPEVPSDISYGRLIDGSNEWVLFKNPTPENSNAGDYYLGINQDSIQFSHESGIYTSYIALHLSGSDNIRYTLDKTDPTENSPLYSSPIYLSENTLLKAKIFDSELFSETTVKNYLFDVSHTIPTISLNTRPDLLWDANYGMYVLGNDYQSSFPYFGANFWEDWEYPFYFTYYDSDGELLLEAHAGAKIFGGWSRALDQKSFSLFARSVYGTNTFKHSFFNARPYAEYESVLLRNSGNDNDRSMMRDAIMTTLLEGTEIDFQEYQPVATYLNGDYWGMYNMREKISENYIASLHNINPDNVDLLEGFGDIKHGSDEDYIALRTFIETHSLADPANYQFVIDQIDEVNFMQYQIAQIFYDNTDWPGNNMRYWKEKDGEWRWIIYDTDFGLNLFNPGGHNNNTLAFATDPNGPGWPNPPWSTLFLRKLLENEDFKRQFINYFADAMNSIFIPQYAKAHVDAIVSNIETEMISHRSRWGHSMSIWNSEITKIKSFFTQRPIVAKNFIKSEFNLPASRALYTTIDEPGEGSIKVNSLFIDVTNWYGVYFENNPISVSAIPKPGYTFDHWSGDITSNDPELELNLTSAMFLTAHFVENSEIEHPVIFNEINYKSHPDQDASDWVELHNISSQSVDVSGWEFKDSNDDHVFEIPQGTVMPGGGFLVLCANQSDFSTVYPSVVPIMGDFTFGLSSNGEAVRLYNEVGELEDWVNYLPYHPWPEDANGQGPTLELISPSLDNSFASSWGAYAGYGTPGEGNHPVSVHNSPFGQKDITVYPNPTKDYLNLQTQNESISIKSVRIYDMQGRLQLFQEAHWDDELVKVDISGLVVGQYVVIVSLQNGGVRGVLVEKML